MSYRFGLLGGDAFQDSSGNAVSLTFKVYATEVDAYNLALTAVAMVQVINGRFSYTSATLPVIWTRLPNGSVAPIFSVEALATVSTGGSLTDYYNKSAIDTLVGSKLSTSQVGVAGGVATLDVTGRITDAEVSTTTNSRLTALESVPAPVAPLPTATSAFFAWRYNATAASNAMVAGNVTEVWEAPLAGVISSGPLVQLDDYGSVDTIVDIEKLTGTTWSTLYSGTKPTVTAGAYLFKAAAPTIQSCLAGDLLRMRLVQTPPTSTTSATAASHPVTLVGYNDATTVASSTQTITMPAGAVGDVVLLVTPNVIFGTLPTGWQVVSSLTSTPNARLTLTILAAPWTSTMANSFTLTASAPMISAPILLRAVDIATIGQVALTDGTEQVGAGTVGTPAFTATNDSDFLVLFCASHFAAPVDGYHQTWGTGPTGATKSIDILTNRGTGTFDYGLAVGFATGVALGASVPSQAITFTGGTGSLANSSSICGAIGIKRSLGSHGPSKITAQVSIRGV